MEQRYPFLRSLNFLLKVLAWVVLVVLVLAALGSVIFGLRHTRPFAPLLGLGLVLYGLLLWAWTYTIAEIILVVLAIEQNTRQTATSLQTAGAQGAPPAS